MATSGAEVGAVYAWIQDKKSYETSASLFEFEDKQAGGVEDHRPCAETGRTGAGVTYGWDSMDHWEGV